MARVSQAGWGRLTDSREAGERPGCLLARGMEAAEMLGSGISPGAYSWCSVQAVLTALGGLPELLEPVGETIVEGAAPSFARRCRSPAAARVRESTGRKGNLVMLCWPPAGVVEGVVLRKVEEP